MILLPNTTYVELYSEMAEAILLDHQGDLIELHVTEPNGDQRYTDEAQDLFEDYSGLVEGVLKGVGIGQDYDLAATTDMVVVPKVVDSKLSKFVVEISARLADDSDYDEYVEPNLQKLLNLIEGRVV
jgi:hypothetical protein